MYNQSDLDAFWARYVVMKPVDVIQLTTPGSPAFEPAFSGMLNFVRQNRLYGFADYAGSCAFPDNGNNKYIGRYS